MKAIHKNGTSSTIDQANKPSGHGQTNRLAGILPPLDAVATVEAKPAPSKDAKALEGRTARGVFAPGNQFARGNPVARRMAALRASLLGNLSPERMTALGDKLYSLALGGDLVAMKLLLQYAIGNPPEPPDADQLNLEEWRLLNTSPTPDDYLRLFAEGRVNPRAAELFEELCPGGLQKLVESMSQERLKHGRPTVENT